MWNPRTVRETYRLACDVSAYRAIFEKFNHKACLRSILHPFAEDERGFPGPGFLTTSGLFGANTAGDSLNILSGVTEKYAPTLRESCHTIP